MKLKIITYAAIVAGCCAGNWIVGMENHTDKNPVEQEQTNETNKQNMTTIDDLVKFFNEKKNLYKLTEITERFGDDIKEACKEIPKNHKLNQSAIMQAMPDNIELVKFLIEFDLDDINAQEACTYMTLLMMCIGMEWSSEITELLIEKGVKLDLQCYLGQTALMWAIDVRQYKIAKLLIEKGANIHLKDKFGKTALTHAVKWANMDIEESFFDLIKTLLLHGAQCDQATKNEVSGKDQKIQDLINTAYVVHQHVNNGSLKELNIVIGDALKNQKQVNEFDFLCMVLRSIAPCDKHNEYCPVNCKKRSDLGLRFVVSMAKNHKIAFAQVIEVLRLCSFISPDLLKLIATSIDYSVICAGRPPNKISQRREDIKDLLLSGKQKNNKEVNKILESHGMVKCDDLHDLTFEYL